MAEHSPAPRSLVGEDPVVLVVGPGITPPPPWRGIPETPSAPWMILADAGDPRQSLAAVRDELRGTSSTPALLAREPALLAQALALGYEPVIGLVGPHGRATLSEAGADLVLRNAEELDPRRLPRRHLPDGLHAIEALREQLAGPPLRIFLDYDGTLTPIVDRPELARLAARERAMLEALSTRAKLAVVSGRDLSDLRRRLALPAVIQVGSHGYECLDPTGAHWRHPGAGEARVALDDLERSLHTQLPRWPGCHVERKAYALAVHYRQLPEPRVHALEDWLSGLQVRWPELRLRDGKKVLEFVPDLPWDKARAVERLLAGPMAGHGPALYIGDDLTDEDVFRLLGGKVIGLRVGIDAGASYANYRLNDVRAVYRLLATLTPPA